MKSILRVFAAIVFTVPCATAGAVVATTAGSNLTAFNGNMGAINNNQWNSMTNSRATSQSTTTARADFGNCNAVIMRCAQPKCSGCNSMDLAVPIVAGCVQSNDTCKQYGDDLIQYMAAQLVANATARDNAARAAAAEDAAAQSAQQLQQMQYQMQQMQADIAAQNQATVAQLQSALEEQKQLTAQAIADANAAQTAAANAADAAASYATTTAAGVAPVSNDGGVEGLTTAQQIAAANGVSADILAREQITGQIYTAIENAELKMKELKTTMQTAFDYAGCDSSGNNCTGPARVKVFKERALQFFDPYEEVLDEIYEALILAQSVGVDITDIYMMLNDSCNSWGQYLCQPGQVMHYTASNCQNGRSVTERIYERDSIGGTVRGYDAPLAGFPCTVGQVIPANAGGCQLTRMLADNEEVQRNWLYPDEGETGAKVRVGCASEALSNSILFRGRQKQASIDVDTLKRMIEQDAPAVYGNNRLSSRATTPETDGLKFCAVSETSLQDLQTAASLKKLPKKVCVTENQLGRDIDINGVVNTMSPATSSSFFDMCLLPDGTVQPKSSWQCKCKDSGGMVAGYQCVCGALQKYNPSTQLCEWSFDNNKSRTSGYMADAFGVVEKYKTETEGKWCMFDSVWNSITQKCECPIWLSEDAKIKCQQYNK